MGLYIKEKAIAVAVNRSAFLLLGFSIIACVALYIYFANSTVRTLANLQNIKRETQSLSVSVSEMESTRLSMESGITPDFAKTLGLVEVSNKTFIIKGGGRTALNFKSR